MKIKKFFYGNISVSFNDQHYLNATAIAKHFNKFVKDYLKTAQTQDYINVLAQNLSVGNIILTADDLVIIKQGGGEQGTWLHPKLAVNFARWLSADFAVWCDLKIDSLVRNELENQQSFKLPQTLPEALRLAADLAEKNQVLQLENKQKSEQIYSMECYFRKGISIPQFVKGLNGVNSNKINAYLATKGWVYKDKYGWRVAAKVRDQYLTEENSEITKHGSDPFITYTPILLRKGAAKLYTWYMEGKLPMKVNWNGEFVQDKVVGL